MLPKFPLPNATSIPATLVSGENLAQWQCGLSEKHATWARTCGFVGRSGQVCVFPRPDGGIESVALGLGKASDRSRGRFHLARAFASLPAAQYHLTDEPDELNLPQEALGVLLDQYRFTRYRQDGGARQRPVLTAPNSVDAARAEAIAAGEFLTRDLINTPAADMGPQQLQLAAEELAKEFNAEFSTITGDELLQANFPMVHAVGRAATQQPRLIEMTWGTRGPTLTLVGKGVCFDTGGLNLKPGASMGLMKKDMGGAATVLGLARMIMALDLPLRLRVLIPAVENAVSSGAFRPGDILTARNGLTVEINNTDAEGRLVLADALAYAAESTPDLMVSMATLTGAARVALGPDMAPFYTDDDTAARHLAQSAAQVADPVWRMPFHAPYETMIEPGIADLDNAPKGGFAGSITAALFLRRFAGVQRYIHFDIYCWQPTAAPGRPKGGVGQGARALLGALPDILRLGQ